MSIPRHVLQMSSVGECGWVQSPSSIGRSVLFYAILVLSCSLSSYQYSFSGQSCSVFLWLCFVTRAAAGSEGVIASVAVAGLHCSLVPLEGSVVWSVQGWSVC